MVAFEREPQGECSFTEIPAPDSSNRLLESAHAVALVDSLPRSGPAVTVAKDRRDLVGGGEQRVPHEP